jgi:fatty acid synthase subunit alpha
MTYDTTDRDGNIRSLPLSVISTSASFSIPSFIQRVFFSLPNLRRLPLSLFPVLHSRICARKASSGLTLLSLATRWASSLLSLPLLISCPNSSLVDVVFYRSLTMQPAVERDELSRSNYAMCAVNPSRVSKTFDDAALREVVDTISNARDCLLEVVNFNVEVRHHFYIAIWLLIDTRANSMSVLASLSHCKPDERPQLFQGAEGRC